MQSGLLHYIIKSRQKHLYHLFSFATCKETAQWNHLILSSLKGNKHEAHTHTHTPSPTHFFLSLSIVHGYLSSVRMSLKYTQSLPLSSHSCRQTHTHLILLLTYQAMQKTQGKPFFNPGTKTAKCNNLGQKC